MIDMYDVTKMTALEEKEFMKTLGAEYRQSYNKIAKEIEDFVEKHGVDKDNMSEALFRKYGRLQSLEKQLGKTIDEMNKVINPTLRGYLGKVYEKNFYGAGYALEKVGRIDLAYSKLDTEAITRSILTDYDNIALKYNAKEVKKKIANSVNQAIIRGESVSDLTKRIKVDLEQNGNKAARIARTTTNRVMGGSRYDSFKHAAKNGLELKKVWVSTLDSRTRTSHQIVDGETIDLDDKFSIGVMYPSDPSGSPSQTINCRCTMVTDIVSGYGNEPMPEDMTLDKWIENLVTPRAIEEALKNPETIPHVMIKTEFKAKYPLNEALKKYQSDSRVVERLRYAEDYLKVHPELRAVIAEYQARIMEAVETKPVSIRRSSNRTLWSILNEGRFKTTYETNTRGDYYMTNRDDIEKKMFGCPKTGLDPKDRPVYGYVDYNPEGGAESGYGAVQFVLKDSVKERTTFTMDDSLDAKAAPFKKGEELNLKHLDPDARYQLEYGVDSALENLNYIEAQIHGGVSLDDVEKIIFHDNGEMLSRDINLENALNDKGIPFEVVRGW